jgi:tetratricopeptide (TPR) repeat protein
MSNEGLPTFENLPDPRRDQLLATCTLRQIDGICDECEQAWRTGAPVPIETRVSAFSGREQATLLRELLAIEVEYRLRKGDCPSASEYLERFPRHPEVVALVFQESASAAEDAVAKKERSLAADIAERNRVAAGSPGLAGSADEAAIPACLHDHPRYRVLKAIGHGGMGTVYLAEHRLMTRLVALKVLRPELMAALNVMDRFLREVKAAASFNHPNIVTAFDAETVQGCHFLVMEYVPGTDLAAVVAQQGPLPVQLACEYVRQAAAGLQHAHEHGIVHRDVKPQNLMLSENGRVKVLDFGLAHVRAEAASANSLTSSGELLGSMDYISPEQAGDPRSADIRSDIYSLGCTLYFLLAGQPPFPAGSLLQKLKAHVEQLPPEIRNVRSEVSPELSAVLYRMMSKDPGDRYQTPVEVASALASWGGASQIQEHQMPERRLFARLAAVKAKLMAILGRKHLPRWGALVLVVLVLVLLGVVVAIRNFPPLSLGPSSPPSGSDPVLAPGTRAKVLYEKALVMLAQREQGQVDGGIQCLKEAIELAPSSALAYTALADAYNLYGDYAWGKPKDCFPEAKRAAESALRHNDRLAEAHLAIAFTLYTYELEWGLAQGRFERALELKPDSAVAHHWYAWFLLQLKGRENLKAAEHHIEESLRLAPLDQIILCNMGKIQYYGGEYETAVSKYKKALETYPRYPKTHLDLGLAYAELKNLDDAKEEFAKAAKGLAKDDRDLIAARAYAYAKNGHSSEAQPLLAQLVQWAREKPLAYEIATIYSALDDKTNAFLWLRKAFDEQSCWRSYIKVDPKLDNLRNDPRFQDFLKDAKFPN